MGNEVALGAVALGAKVVEKHFVLNRKINGPDASFSMTPDEFEKMVKSIRKIEAAMGNVSYNSASEKSRVFARSLFIVKDVKKGDTITRDNIRCIRPGYGIAPKYLNDVLGKTFNDDYQRGTPLNWEQINQ